MNRGQCPGCLDFFTLKKDGTLHSHYAAAIRDEDDHSAKKCSGAGELPLTEKRPLWR